MGEPNRVDDQLTTADLTKRTQTREDAQSAEGNEKRLVDRPQLVQNEAEAAQPSEQELDATTPLLSGPQITDLRSRWSDIQAAFVDEPRRAVETADQLVATAMQRLAEGFAKERESLEKQWDQGDSVSTEDLRIALQRYRSFFGKLLNAA
jgi:hypothetical protein